MFQFKLPDIGEGTHEAEIVQWHVNVGDEVKEDDTLVEIQSDKATADLPSPVDGIVTKRVGEEGELAIVGSVILEIDTGEGGSDDSEDGDQESAEEAPTDEQKTPSEKEQDSKPAHTPSQEPIARQMVHDENVDIRTLAVPRVRHFAREKGIDLRTIEGTGRSGLITMDDVEAALASGADAQSPTVDAATGEESVAADQSGIDTVKQAAGVPAPIAKPKPVADTTGAAGSQAQAPTEESKPARPRRATTAADGPEERVTMSPIRKATAKALAHAAATVPHVTIFDRADVGDLVEHRKRLKSIGADRGIKLTYVPYIVKACVAMLKANPDLNAYVDMDAGEIVYRSTYHIGVAVNTDAGLFVPVVRDADRLSLFEIATEIDYLVDLAKAGKLTKKDMSGGSMTVTNVGGAAIGGVWSTPILNMPESCIVGIGRIEDEFMPDEEGQPILRPMMKLSYVFDHRLVDGVTAQQGLNHLRTYLSNPDLLLAES